MTSPLNFSNRFVLSIDLGGLSDPFFEIYFSCLPHFLMTEIQDQADSRSLPPQGELLT